MSQSGVTTWAPARFFERMGIGERPSSPQLSRNKILPRIKEKDGPQLIVWGSSELTPVLLEHELADEVLLLVFPVLLGKGKRIFADGTPPRELALVSTKAVGSGVIISTYKPNGPLRTSSYADARGRKLDSENIGGNWGQTRGCPTQAGFA